ncbi:hypothetical protein FB451DRAFT_1519185 [Mycena latifolia]|nr:hypothetical protein FB451DRAFT_1519185 [Mycena latifolia]
MSEEKPEYDSEVYIIGGIDAPPRGISTAPSPPWLSHFGTHHYNVAILPWNFKKMNRPTSFYMIALQQNKIAVKYNGASDQELIGTHLGYEGQCGWRGSTRWNRRGSEHELRITNVTERNNSNPLSPRCSNQAKAVNECGSPAEFSHVDPGVTRGFL